MRIEWIIAGFVFVGIFGMFFFFCRDLLEQPPRGGIVPADIVDHLPIRVDGDTFREVR